MGQLFRVLSSSSAQWLSAVLELVTLSLPRTPQFLDMNNNNKHPRRFPARVSGFLCVLVRVELVSGVL